MTTSPRPRADEGPRTVGDYTLLSLLGEGGMGVVYLARHQRTGERVALKILRPQIVGDEEGRVRLEREVSSLERVRSRWVAEIRDADPWAEVAYVATRYVPGPPLHDFILDEGPVDGGDLLWLARCLADGIAACHEAGVLHRDVKPSNVIMEGRTPVLIDFGLARVADDPKITQTGWLLGTPGYLPPEILHGEPATEATDVHSWGATVAFAATGRPPFGQGPSMAIMDRARRGQCDLTGCPEPLRPVLAAALDPEPSRRPSLDELRGWLQDPSDPPAFAGPPATRTMTTEEAEEEPPLSVGHWKPTPRVSFAERLRRGCLWTVAMLTAAAAFAAVPFVTLAVLCVLAWLLRSGSMAASDLVDRRVRRGAKWYDGPRLILRAPWDLLRSIPSTLLLIIWSVGIALAAGLLGYATAAGQAVTLAAVGGVFAAMLCAGPGGDRVRGPLGRVVHPLARGVRRWLIATLLLAAGAAFLGWVATVGAHWVPLGSRPGFLDFLG